MWHSLPSFSVGPCLSWPVTHQQGLNIFTRICERIFLLYDKCFAFHFSHILSPVVCHWMLFNCDAEEHKCVQRTFEISQKKKFQEMICFSLSLPLYMLASFEIALTKHNHLHLKDFDMALKFKQNMYVWVKRVFRLFSSSLVVLALNEFKPIYSMLTS